jgi:hypothetical protein
MFSKGCEMVWNFFATGHGKGEVDGTGALLKREVKAEQIKPQRMKLQNAREIVQYLRGRANRPHTSYSKVRRHTNNFFHKIGVGEVDRSKPYSVTTVDGNRGMHQVRSLSAVDDTLCEFRQLSCFCEGCMDKFSLEPCTSKAHVEEWSLTRLRIVKSPPSVLTRRRTRIQHVANKLQSHIQPNCEGPSDVVEDHLLPGHNIAIPTDLDSEPFWLMLVNKSAHVVDAEFLDYYGNTWRPCDTLIRGYYYERLQYSTFLTKFQMPPIKHAVRGSYTMYELRECALERILNALEERSLLD